MKSQPSSSSLRALFAGACLVAATGCSIAIPGVRLPGVSSTQGEAVATDDPCAGPPAQLTAEQRTQCYQQASKRRREKERGQQQAQADAEKQAREAILSRAVVGKFPGLVDEDAIDPRKVAEVLGKVTPDMLVHGFAVHAPEGPWATTNRQCHDPRHVGETPELSEFGAALVSDYDFTRDGHRRPRRAPYLQCNDDKVQRSLTKNDPAVVWAPYNQSDSQVILIGLDGSRYLAKVDALRPGAPDKATWPPSAPNPIIYPDDVLSSVERGKFPKERLAGVLAASEKYERCYASVAPKFEKQLEQHLQANITYSARDARMRAVGVAWDKENRQKCGKAYEAFIPAAKRFMAEEKARREKLYQETVARLKQ